MKLAFGITARLVAVLALGLHGAASAQVPPTGLAVVEWLATEACGDFLTGELKLAANPALKERGFGETVTKRDSKVGPIDLVTAKFGASEIVFGGAADKMCTITVVGDLAAPSLPVFRKSVDGYNVKLERVDEKSKALSPEVSQEVFKAKATEDFNVYVVLIESLKSPSPLMSFSLFFSKE